MCSSDLAAEPQASAIPVWLVAPSDVTRGLRDLTADQTAWLKSIAFTGAARRLALLPGTGGKLAGAVFGTGDRPTGLETPATLVGLLPTLLPPGTYRLMGDIGASPLAATAWGLGAYRFNRYKSAKGDALPRLGHAGEAVLRAVERDEPKVGMVEEMRKTIIDLGGEIRFQSRVDDIEIQDGQVQSVTLQNGEKIATHHLVLAVGHSARDTFEMIYKRGVYVEAKPFSIGFRIEHPQSLIDRARHGQRILILVDEWIFLHPADGRLGALDPRVAGIEPDLAHVGVGDRRLFEHAHQSGVAAVGPQVAPVGPFDPFRRAVAGGRHAAGLGDEVAHQHAHDLAEQLVLGPEVRIERAVGDRSLAGDVTDAGLGVALLLEDPAGGLDELGPGAAPPLGDRFGRGAVRPAGFVRIGSGGCDGRHVLSHADGNATASCRRPGR